MATSAISISNLALSHLGVKASIQSFDEASAEAKACKAWYSQSLEMALEAFDWSFARKREALAEHDEDPPPDWAYRYTYPSGCIKMRKLQQVSRQADEYPYHIEADADGVPSILTNVPDAVGIFTFRNNNPLIYPPHFVLFLSHLMAANMAVRLTGKRSLRKENMQDAGVALRAASGLNAGEQVNEPERESELIRERL
jgi:hypothetical protein